MTTFSKVATTVAVTVGLLASNIGLASSGQASDRRWDRGQHRPYAAYGYGRHQPPPVHHGRRDRSGDAIGAAILGIGALIVGAAIADATRKKRHYDDE